MNNSFHPSGHALLTTSHAKSLKALIKRWKNNGDRVAFVPTMGALHEGHLSLMRLARAHADKVVVSIFVNPAQFAPHEDFDAYPRDLQRDMQLIGSGADVVYAPKVPEIYPNGLHNDAMLGIPSSAAYGLESDFRPHFFGGVQTVVRILFDQVQPDIALFGEKDFQQLMVIREMVAKEALPIEIIGAPIVRDEYGLALSSRNAYLATEELEIARMMNQIIHHAAFEMGSWPQPEDGRHERILEDTKHSLLTSGFDKVDYVVARWRRVLAAARIGKTRLIDNCALKQKGTE